MNDKKRLLLHTCCAPCSCLPVADLSNDYNLTQFFYNPNIQPIIEYNLRKNELIDFNIKYKNTKLVIKESTADFQSWIENIRPYRYYGEKSKRCQHCFYLRLDKTFEYAQQNNFEFVTTTLTISPHKNSDIINSIGLELTKKYNIEFLARSFKENNGYKKSCEISKSYNLYRQNYCGCIYSKLERDKSTVFSRKLIMESLKL